MRRNFLGTYMHVLSTAYNLNGLDLLIKNCNLHDNVYLASLNMNNAGNVIKLSVQERCFFNRMLAKFTDMQSPILLNLL
jgi:hypothetical protein